MTYIYDIFDTDQLHNELDAKRVKEQSHPEFPFLKILNYTDSVSWDNAWNDVNMQCRGLIYSTLDNLAVYARPFPKFFNHDQEQAPVFQTDDRLYVTDKLDGSLGILYTRPDGLPAIATRGSFASEQALWATEFYRKVFHGQWNPDPAYTYMFEIIYPGNRIVVDYDGLEDLVLLGAVEIKSGTQLTPSKASLTGGIWPGNSAEVHFQDATLAEVLAHPPRDNREGFVLHHLASNRRVKLKYEDYKLLHKYLTNTTARHVHEVLASGQDPAEVFAAAPDEFHDWLKDVVANLEAEYARVENDVNWQYSLILTSFDNEAESFTRKDFALKAKESKYSGMLFKMYDGRTIHDDIWKMVRPEGGITAQTFRKVSSDAD